MRYNAVLPVFILLVVNILYRITVWLYHYPHSIVTTGRSGSVILSTSRTNWTVYATARRN